MTGIKLEFVPEILSTNPQLSPKVFTLLPSGLETVRDVKNHLIQKFNLTTPFHFFVDDFRVMDDEDSDIFRVSNHTFKVVAIPVRKSSLRKVQLAIQGTPPRTNKRSYNGSFKKVQFDSYTGSDNDAEDDDYMQCIDQIDDATDFTGPTASSTPTTCRVDEPTDNTVNNCETVSTLNQEEVGVKNQHTSVAKKRRERRLKNMRRKIEESLNIGNEDSENKTEISPTKDVPCDSASCNGTGGGDGLFKAPQVQQKHSRVSLNGSSPNGSSHGAKKRPDTPRVIKKQGVLSIYQFANGELSTIPLCDGLSPNDSGFNSEFDKNGSGNSLQAQKKIRQNDRSYFDIKGWSFETIAVASIDQLASGDKIIVKVLELNESNCPVVSGNKLGEVCIINGDVMKIRYLDEPENEKAHESDIINEASNYYPAESLQCGSSSEESLIAFASCIEIRKVLGGIRNR